MKSRFAIFIMISMLGLVSCDHQEQTWTPEGKVIETVAIDLVGEKFIDENKLKSIIRSATGDTYTAHAVDIDIRALFESGYVDDIRVLAEPKGDKVGLIFEVTTRPTMGPVLFVGNAAFSDQNLAKKIEIRRGKNAEPPTPELLTDSASRIEAYYRSHGYPLAVVHVSAFGGGPATADDFQFVIREGDPEPSESNKKKHNKAEMATPRKPSD